MKFLRRVVVLLLLPVLLPLLGLWRLAAWLWKKRASPTLTRDADGRATPFEDLELTLVPEGDFRRKGKDVIEEADASGSLAIVRVPLEGRLPLLAMASTPEGRDGLAAFVERSMPLADAVREASPPTTGSLHVSIRAGLLGGRPALMGTVVHASGVLAISAVDPRTDGGEPERFARCRRIIASVRASSADELAERAKEELLSEAFAAMKQPDSMVDCARVLPVTTDFLQAVPAAVSLPFAADLHWLCVVEGPGKSWSAIREFEMQAAGTTPAALLAAAAERAVANELVNLVPCTERVFRQHSNAGCPLLSPKFHSTVRERFPKSHLLALVSSRRVLVAEDSASGLSELTEQLETELQPDPFLGSQHPPSPHVYRVAGEAWSVADRSSR